MADGLTEAAKAEIAAAIAIVREDRFEKYARATVGKHAPKEEVKEEKPKDELLQEKETVNPPPAKEEEKPAKEDETKPERRSAYWGIFEE